MYNSKLSVEQVRRTQPIWVIGQSKVRALLCNRANLVAALNGIIFSFFSLSFLGSFFSPRRRLARSNLPSGRNVIPLSSRLYIFSIPKYWTWENFPFFWSSGKFNPLVKTFCLQSTNSLPINDNILFNIFGMILC